MNTEPEKKGCCCGAPEKNEPAGAAACCGGADKKDGPVINASCCGPSSPGMAKVRLFVLAFFVIAAIIVMVYGSMHK